MLHSKSLALLASCTLVGCALAAAEIEDTQCVHFLQSSLKTIRNIASERNPEHHWPTAFGKTQTGSTELVGPRNMSAHLAWTWHHPAGKYHTTLAGGPVLDSENNLYVTTGHGVFKLSSSGQQLWEYPMEPYTINNMPVLMGETVYLATKNGSAIALDIDSGKQRWAVQVGSESGPDCGYPSAHDGLFVMSTEKGHHPSMDGGNTKIVALNGSTGEQLWEYHASLPTWNFSPLFPGDDTLVFMDFSGGVYRLGLHNGTEVWHTPAPGSENSFSDGGTILGPNGVVYSCSNPASERGGEGGKGVLRAFKLSDGSTLWQQILPQSCNSYPAVGHLGDSQALSVVVTPGNFMGSTQIHGGIMSFDATTGALLWQYQAPLYRTPTGQAVGDVEGIIERGGSICLPAHWSAPIITGDGTIYAGRSDGKMYAVRGPSRSASQALEMPKAVDFASTDGLEVETFDVHGSSLHGSIAFAPGMMAFATCTDSVYVLKY